MKYHRATVSGVTVLLQQIFEQGCYPEQVVSVALKQNTVWGSRDRRFVAETTYQMVRWWRLINASLPEEHSNSEFHYYQLFAVWQLIGGNELPDWKEFKELDRAKIIEKAEHLKLTRKYRESIPDWLDELGVAELGEETWTKELAELNKMATLVLRVNTLKTSPKKLQQLFSSQQIETTIIESYPDALISAKRQNFYLLKEFKQGLFEIQDASSQLVAPFLKPEGGMTVIDACAGAGGKSLHIAAMMNNKGKIIAMDVDEKKLFELNKRAQRNGIKIIETRLINEVEIEKLKYTADRLLLDVPCSGLGVLRRKPFDKWKLSLQYINEKKQEQQKILSHYSAMLKPGGIMVYATCSILPSENQLQIEEFLNNNTDFELMEDRKVLPGEGFDGFYMARMRRVR